MWEMIMVCLKDGSGQIDQQELGDMLSDLGLTVSKGDLRRLFRDADTDGGGYIDFEEFVAIFKKADAGDDSIWQQVHCGPVQFWSAGMLYSAVFCDTSFLLAWD